MGVVILFGGSSSERLVSVASAQNVSRVLAEAQPWFLSRSGAVHPVDRDALAAHPKPFENELTPAHAAAFPSLAAALDAPGSAQHVFFLALHGGEGENGTLQRELERRRLAFTGSGSTASANAFDKAIARELAAAKGARLATSRLLAPMARADAEAALRELLAAHPRWVLKPVADGSSYGLVHLTGPEVVAEAAAMLADLKVRYLAEEFIVGRELTVGVVDWPEGTAALPVSEVRLAPSAAFDYAGKYLGRGTEEITPALLTADEAKAAQALGVLAHRAVGCEGYSRTDMILSGTGLVFLETNTLPGLTKASFIPQQLAAAGRDFKAFLELQLELGRRRAARR